MEEQILPEQRYDSRRVEAERFIARLETCSPDQQVTMLANFFGEADDSRNYALYIAPKLSLSARLIGLNGILRPNHYQSSILKPWDDKRGSLPECDELRSRLEVFMSLQGRSRKVRTWNGATSEQNVSKDQLYWQFNAQCVIGAQDSRRAMHNWRQLAYAEDINRESFLWLHEFDPLECGNDVRPFDALGLLGQVKRYSARGGAPFAGLIYDLVPLANELYDAVMTSAVAKKDWVAVGEMNMGGDLLNAEDMLIEARVSGYTYDNVDSIYTTISKEVEVELDYYLMRLYEASDKLSTCFAPALAQQVQEAFLRVTTPFILGLAEHEKNGKHTRSELVLGDDFRLPVKLDGDEPQQLLESLLEAVDAIYKARFSETSIITDKTIGNGFRLFRYTNTEGKFLTDSRVLEYIRPFGDYSYNSVFEHGRPTEGVEASHGFTYSRSQYVKSTKGVDSNALSVRIDFEGLDPMQTRDATAGRDPCRKIGTLSLDVGSILGSANNLGVRIGRFLGWSNQLRAQNVLSERPAFNHGHEAFPPGDRQQFGAMLQAAIAERDKDPRRHYANALARLVLSVA